MKLNIKKAAAILTPAISYLALTGSALASGSTSFNFCNPTDPNTPFNVLCKQNAGSLGSIVFGVIVLLFIIAVIVALVFLIWGGLKWIFSGGDKAAVESARNTIIAAIIGLVIVFSAFFLLNLITQILIGQTITNLTLPTIFK
ncbi:MAG: hypothetical protein HYT11_02220 [Candidatus Levybacteria bacterium]|nr:hypothetical protein [Candidatus Levybacteria bacterium]